MAQLPRSASSTYRAVRRNPWAIKWARLGFATGGVVYVLIGAIAATVAFEGRGRIVGAEGAVERIGNQPFGRLLLILVAVGLAGYSLWRVVQAIEDADRDGSDWKGLAVRAGIMCSAIGYGSLSIFAFERAAGSAAGRGGAGRHWTAEILRHDWGIALACLAGAIMIVAAVAEAYYGATGGFRERLALRGLDSSERAWVVRFGTWGFLAQACVLGVAGWFLIYSALKRDPGSVVGLDGALRQLAGRGYGPWLLGAVALGLACYGAFMLMQARYRKLS